MLSFTSPVSNEQIGRLVGIYELVGEWNGHPFYTKRAGNLGMWFESDGAATWQITELFDANTILATAQSDDDIPPQHGWMGPSGEAWIARCGPPRQMLSQPKPHGAPSPPAKPPPIGMARSSREVAAPLTPQQPAGPPPGRGVEKSHIKREDKVMAKVPAPPPPPSPESSSRSTAVKREAEVTTDKLRAITIGEIDKLLREDPRFRGVDVVDMHGKKRGGWYNKCQLLCEAILVGRQDIAVMASTLWRRQGGMTEIPSDGSRAAVPQDAATEAAGSSSWTTMTDGSSAF